MVRYRGRLELHPIEANAELRADIENTLIGNYAGLRLIASDDGPALEGTLIVGDESGELDRFEIRLRFPIRYPDEHPILQEIGGRIPKTQERHINGDGTACLCVPLQWTLERPDLRLRTFLDGPVRTYFLSQSLIDQGGTWQHGERRHGREGELDALVELSGLGAATDGERLEGLMLGQKVPGHEECPCGSGRRVRDCHAVELRALHTRIPDRWRVEQRTKRRERMAKKV